MPAHVAIIGAGPAGFYAAEALLETLPDVQIDFIERLPTPYGLVRAGVAPDHQTTKKVTRRFEQTARRSGVQYFGNVQVGRDVDLAELQDFYDAVVLAVGSPRDRYLGVPGEDKQGVYGSALFVGWYNGHPDFSDLNPRLDATAAVVVGNGNVALDVARVLVKTPEEMAVSDIADHAAARIQSSPLTDIYLLGRRGPLQAKFTNVELREMGRLADASPIVDPADLPDGVGDAAGREGRLMEKNLATLREFAGKCAHPDAAAGRKRVHFRFWASPVEILGDDRVNGIRVERTRMEGSRAVGTGVFGTIPCGLVVPSIGYRSAPLPGVPFDERRGLIPSTDGRVVPGLYAVGWAKRGPTGVIASNRPDGAVCARQIVADLGAGGGHARPEHARPEHARPGHAKPGRAALIQLLARRHTRVVTFDDWCRIDAAEVAAGGGAPRRKLTSLDEMLRMIARAPIH